jgi:hypothetical protein
MMATSQKDPICIGGLMRCCLKTYDDIAPSVGMASEGDTLQCSYTDSSLHSMRLRDGAWEWNHD